MVFLLVLPTDRLGGAERVAMNLVRFLAKNEKNLIHVHFLSMDDSKCWHEFKNKPTVHITYSFASSVKVGFINFLKVLHKVDGNINYIYSTHTHVNMVLCILRRVKILQCENLILRESSILSTRFDGIKKWLINICYLPYGVQDLLICQTQLMKRKLIEHRGRRISKNSIVISNPIDLEKIQSNSKVSYYEFDSKRFNVVMVGRLVEIKNHKLVIEALSRTKLDLNLVIVGDGPLKKDLYELAEGLNSKTKFEFVGNVSNPYKFMKGADLGVISSFSEGFPNVLIEMMAAGTKDIIITPCTGDLELIPAITITTGFGVEEMAKIISEKFSTPVDNSITYESYSTSRDIASYWSRIEEVLENKL
ncbi:glycosyltransferase [Vibrio breoganii]